MENYLAKTFLSKSKKVQLLSRSTFFSDSHSEVWLKGGNENKLQ